MNPAEEAARVITESISMALKMMNLPGPMADMNVLRKQYERVITEIYAPRDNAVAELMEAAKEMDGCLRARVVDKQPPIIRHEKWTKWQRVINAAKKELEE